MRHLSNLQILRGIAALLVVLVHGAEQVGDWGFGDPPPEMYFGEFGVDLFFVVSGFIMVHANATAFGESGAWGNFLWRRFARLCPLYWCVTVLYLLATLRTPLNKGYTPAYVVASVLFVPWPEPADGAAFPLYFPGWTLNYEMFFYGCFSLVLCFSRRHGVVLLSFGLIGLVLLHAVLPLPWPLGTWGDSQSLEFVFGMVIAEVRLRFMASPQRVFWSSWPFCFSLGLLGCAAVPLVMANFGAWPPWRGLLSGLPAAAVVTAAVFWRTGGTGPVRRWLEHLGDASYSLYLVHLLVFMACHAVVWRLFRHPERAPGWLYVAGLVLAAVAAAHLCHRLFERPVTRLLQGLARRGGADRVMAVPARPRPSR